MQQSQIDALFEQSALTQSTIANEVAYYGAQQQQAAFSSSSRNCHRLQYARILVTSMYDQQTAPSVARQQLDELTRRSAPTNGGMHHLPTVPEDASLPASSFTPQPSSSAAAPRPLVHEFNQARQQKGELCVHARVACYIMQPCKNTLRIHTPAACPCSQRTCTRPHPRRHQ